MMTLHGANVTLALPWHPVRGNDLTSKQRGSDLSPLHVQLSGRCESSASVKVGRAVWVHPAVNGLATVEPHHVLPGCCSPGTTPLAVVVLGWLPSHPVEVSEGCRFVGLDERA